jgi:hypothetical protein
VSSAPSSDRFDELPAELRAALQEGLGALDHNPTGELPLGLRKRIYALLGPESRDTDNRPTGVGYRRRVLLDVLAAQRALPVWERAHPGDRRPQRMLLLANGVVRGTVDRAAAEREMSNFLVDVGSETNPMDPGPGYAGTAAASVVSTARVDRHHDDFAGAESDADLDADAWPTDFLASEAAALATSPEENADQRRAFWKWFLTEAVPAAYLADSVNADH